MPTVSRAVLLNVGVFLADNNIRRSVASFALNYATTDASANVTHVTVQPGSTYTFMPVVTPSSILVVQTSLPLVADVTYDDVAVPERLSVSVKTLVNRLWVTDDSVTGIVFENFNAEPARLSIVQG